MRDPDSRRPSSAKAIEPLPTEAMSESTSNRLLMLPPKLPSERDARGHAGQPRIQERGRPQPEIRSGGRVGRGDVLNRIAVQRVVEVEGQSQPAPAKIDALVHREVQLIEAGSKYRLRRQQIDHLRVGQRGSRAAVLERDVRR